jgi:hypothetical protein
MSAIFINAIEIAIVFVLLVVFWTMFALFAWRIARGARRVAERLHYRLLGGRWQG